jgi:hypothetical protein
VYVQTMFVIGLGPPIDCAIKLLWARYKYFGETGNWLKGESNSGKVKSFSKNIAQFVSSYSAPQMIIDFRYAGLTLNIFVALIFGPGMPVLFPLALFNLIVMYILDRLMTAYFYS